MSLTHDDVQKILKIIDELDYAEVQLEIGDLKLHLRKSGAAGEARMDPLSSGQEKPRIAPEKAGPAQQTTSAAVPQTVKTAGAAIPAGQIAVRAPMLGTFYRAPAPGERPFVEAGDKVGPDDTVCLVEVMKLFNSVKAGVAGTVASILAENGSMIEHGQVLILIQPAADATAAAH